MTPTAFDPATCKRTLEVLHSRGEVIELRAPIAKPGVPRWKSIAAGYYDDFQLLVNAAAELNGHYTGLNVTLNPIRSDLLAWSANRIDFNPKRTTSDDHVLRRRWFFLDFDPDRLAEISSTEEEQKAAFAVARQCREWLTALGWPEPVRADSGNGAHLLYRIDLPNDQESRKLIESCLKALDLLFSTDAVDVDKQTDNASRLVKLYGTLSRKGDTLLDRLHRLSRLLHVPDRLEAVPVELLN